MNGCAYWSVRLPAHLLALCAAAAVLATACSSDGPEDASGDGGDSTEIRTSPIADLLGRELDQPDNPAAAQRRQLEEEQEREDLIAGCMAEKGFEYVPVDAATLVGVAAEGDAQWGTREWAERWGYGVTTRWFPQSVVGEGLIGYDDPRIGGDQAEEDPNAAIVAGLDPEQQDAYYAALYGDYSGVDDSGGDDTVEEGDTGGDDTGGDDSLGDDSLGDDGAGGSDDLDGDGLTGSFDEAEFEPLGCEGEAYTEVASYDAAIAFEAQFEAELAAMHEQIEQDPRMVEANQQLSDCVIAKGLDYQTADQYRAAVESTFAILQQELYPTQSLSAEELEQLSPEEVDAAFDQTGALSPEGVAQLSDLQTREVELAVAALECGQGSDEYQATVSEVRVEYEQAFLDEHADEVAEYRD